MIRLRSGRPAGSPGRATYLDIGGTECPDVHRGDAPCCRFAGMDGEEERSSNVWSFDDAEDLHPVGRTIVVGGETDANAIPSVVHEIATVALIGINPGLDGRFGRILSLGDIFTDRATSGETRLRLDSPSRSIALLAGASLTGSLGRTATLFVSEKARPRHAFGVVLGGFVQFLVGFEIARRRKRPFVTVDLLVSPLVGPADDGFDFGEGLALTLLANLTAGTGSTTPSAVEGVGLRVDTLVSTGLEPGADTLTRPARTEKPTGGALVATLAAVLGIARQIDAVAATRLLLSFAGEG